MMSRRTTVRLALEELAGGPPDRALSIRQPWAWAILYAGKRVENRSWYMAYRGPIFIHAGRTVEYQALEGLQDEILAVPQPRQPAVCGALLGVATVIDCIRPEDVPEDQQRWAVGPWCILLGDVRPLADPRPFAGKLGLFRVI